MLYLGFPILSFIFILIFVILYYSKERVSIFENKIVISLMICNLFGLLFEIGCYIVLAFYQIQDTVLGMFVLKTYIVYISLFNWLITGYIFVITSHHTNEASIRKYYYKILLYFLPLLIINVLIAYSTPLNYYAVYPKFYTYGTSTMSIFISFIILFPLWMSRSIICIYENHVNKKFSSKIYLLLLGILLVGAAGSIMQFVDKSVLIIGATHSILLTLIYFTIENPDVKMLEELHKSKEASDSANEEKAMFLYNMTQEIRGTVNEINNNANDILDSDSIEENKDSARNIIATTSKFSTMTNDMLDISNVENATVKVYNSKYNVKTILKQLVSVYNDKCKNKGLNFITNIDNNVPDEMYGDSIGLKEILNTVLDNAYKYTNKGYVEFDVNTIIKNDICRLIITVEDSGIGIKSENINNLKVSNTSLAKANNLIIKMNGTMLISSDFGVGTKIKVVLDQRIEINTNSEIAKYDNIFNNINILCVDDSEAGLKIVDKLLKGTNIKIDKAETGKECLDKIKINKYDLVLLDEELSQITGIELMGKIKEIRNFKTPVILLTKDNSYEYNEEYSKVGFTDYLLKPLKKEILIEKINEYTEKK